MSEFLTKRNLNNCGKRESKVDYKIWPQIIPNWLCMAVSVLLCHFFNTEVEYLSPFLGYVLFCVIYFDWPIQFSKRDITVSKTLMNLKSSVSISWNVSIKRSQSSHQNMRSHVEEKSRLIGQQPAPSFEYRSKVIFPDLPFSSSMNKQEKPTEDLSSQLTKL